MIVEINKHHGENRSKVKVINLIISVKNSKYLNSLIKE